MSTGAHSVSGGTVRGSKMPWWSRFHPQLVGSIVGGDSSSAVFHVATCRWHLLMFSMNASLVGGREQSLVDDAALFPVLKRHILILHSVNATLPYVAHMNFVA